MRNIKKMPRLSPKPVKQPKVPRTRILAAAPPRSPAPPSPSRLMSREAIISMKDRRIRKMPRLSEKATPLAPGDPNATNIATLPGPNGIGNTIETNTNYTMGQEDRVVLVVQNGATVTLPEEPLLGYPVYIVADGGIVTVSGPIRGGNLTLAQGTIGILTYSAISGEWSSASGNGDGATGATGATGASGTSAAGVPNLAALRAVIGTTNEQIVMGGYYAPGDGGGGTFFWDPTSSTGDDGITIIVPTGSTTGRWLRIYDPGVISVRWAGAKGDGEHNDTAAIQAALDWNSPASSTVFMPAGTYYVVSAPGEVALVISHTVSLLGESLNDTGGQTGTTILANGGATGPLLAGSVILIEPPQAHGGYAQNTRISNLSFAAQTNTPSINIIVHAANCVIENIAFNSSASRYGLLVESGTVNTPATPDSVWPSENVNTGYTLLSTGTEILADFTQCNNLTYYACPIISQFDTTVEAFTQPVFGDSITLTVGDSSVFAGCGNFTLVTGEAPIIGIYYLTAIDDPTHVTATLYNNGTGPVFGAAYPQLASVPNCFAQVGAAQRVEGPNVGGSMFSNIFPTLCQTAFKDGSQIRDTYINCYSQSCIVGYNVYGDAPIQFYNCNSEDYTIQVVWTQAGCLAVGGSISDRNASSADVESVGNGYASLEFYRLDAQGNKWGATIPAANQSACMSVFHNASAYYLQYLDSVAPWSTDSLSWVAAHPMFGWTEPANTRGTGLFFVASPTMNTQHQWKWPQTNIALAPGANTVYINGGSSDAGAFTFSDNGTGFWPNADIDVNVKVQYANLTAMQANPCHFAGWCLTSVTGTESNIACTIVNESESPVTVTLIWEFGLYVTNYTSGTPGQIG